MKVAKHIDAPVQAGDTLLLHAFGIGTVTQIREIDGEVLVFVKTHHGEPLHLTMAAAAKRLVL